MDVSNVIDELERNRKVFLGMFQELPSEFVIWKANPKDWCILEIVCHLIDEEVEDFRARIDHTLNTPDKPLVSIDPPGWVISRNYIGQNFESSVERWQQERQNSIAWLRGLSQPQWENTVKHPDLGPQSARSFLYNWLAHDYLHIRQINRIRRAYLFESSGDSLTYAGKW